MRAITISRRTRSDDGFIIVAVLWLLGALAALVSIYAVYLVDTAVGFGAHDERLQSEALVTAALELTAYRLTRRVSPSGVNSPTGAGLAKPSQSRPTQGGFKLRMGQASVGVEFRSEAARIDINAASKEVLAGLFVVLGARRDDAENYANRIVAWRTAPPQGEDTEAAFYRSAGLRYVPRGAPFPHVDELSLVLGGSTALLARAWPFITVYSGRAAVNVLEAAPEVFAALPGMTPDRLQLLLAQRQATPTDAERLLALLGPAREFATSEGSKASRITVHVAFDTGRQIASQVVILMFEDDNEPYSVLSWRDQPDE
jgi:general secretion pathway protein K